MLNEELDAEGRERASARSSFDILESKANGPKYGLNLNSQMAIGLRSYYSAYIAISGFVDPL